MRRLTSLGSLALLRGDGTACVPRTASAPSPSAPSRSSALVLATRHASLLQRLKSVSNSKMANAYQPGKFTAKGIPQGPQAGVGFDPVYNNYIASKTTGPLRRKTGSSQEDYYDVDELAAWMEAKHAAKLLYIKEDELPTLTKATLEERWKKAYRSVNDAKKEEVLIATEVLLEYIDSTLRVKKSKQYYREFLQNARLSVDDELQRRKSENRTYMMYGLAILFTGASLAILLVAYFRNYIGRQDAETIGTRAADYVSMTFLQNNNVEDPPDYSTRYFRTPTAMDVDKQSGQYDTAFLDSEEVRMLREREEYDRREEAEMLRMLNDENDALLRAARDDKARSSRVSVLRPEDLVEGGQVGTATARQPAKEKAAKRGRYEDMTFGAFAGMMASGFGGGSRFQRLTNESSARAAELRKLKERREALAGGGGGDSSGSDAS